MSGRWLETVNFYDDKGRVLQVLSDNYKGGNDVLTNRYDFNGKIVSSYQVHSNPSGNTHNLRIKTNMEYDHTGRLVKVRKMINDDLATQRTVAINSYDALGQLKHKMVGQKKRG